MNENHNTIKGSLYGIGVGPGEPELMTLKAARILREAQVIAVPAEDAKKSAAFLIAAEAVPEIREKELLEIDMPMTRNPDILEKAHALGAERLAKQLEEGKTVAFITIGDPTVYSTYLYVHRRVADMGYQTGLISGVPSFCAAAAALDLSLAEGAEAIYIEAGNRNLEQKLKMPGMHVIMKTGKEFHKVVEILKNLSEDPDIQLEVHMAENVGYKEKERCFSGISQLPDEAGYFSLLFVRTKAAV